MAGLRLFLYMRYIIFVLWIFLLGACRRSIPMQGVVADYQEYTPKVIPKTIAIDFDIAYDSLFTYFNLRAGRTLYDSKNQSGIDFPLQLRLIQKPQVQIRRSGNVGIVLPVQIEASPKLAGINTGLIQAKSNLMFDFKWNWTDINHRDISELNLGYHWVSMPEMKVLGFPVQVQGIVDPLIQRQLPETQANLSQQLNRFLSPTALSGILNSIPMSYSTEYGMIGLHASEVDLKNVLFQNKGLHGILQVRTALDIGDVIEPANPNRWVELQSASNRLPFRFTLSYQRIVQLIKNIPEFKSYQFNITSDTSTIIVDLKSVYGKQMNSEIRVKPVLVGVNTIGLQVVSMELTGVPFLFRGHLKHKIISALNQFQFGGNVALQSFNQNSWGLQLEKGNVKIDKLIFNRFGLGLIGDISGNWVLRK